MRRGAISSEFDKGIAGSPFLNSPRLLWARAFSRRFAGAGPETQPISPKVAKIRVDWLRLLTWLLAPLGSWAVVLGFGYAIWWALS